MSRKAWATPRWSPLGVKFKISDEHPHLFHIGVLPPGFQSSVYWKACQTSENLFLKCLLGVLWSEIYVARLIVFCGVSIRLFDFGRFKLRSNVRFCGWVASVEYCQSVVICSLMKLISALTDLVFLVGLDFIVQFVPVFSWAINFALVMIWWCVIPWKLFLGVIWMEKVADLSSRDCFWSLMTILFDSFIFQMMKISSANYLSLYSFPSESPIDDVRMTFNWTEDGVNLSLLF